MDRRRIFITCAKGITPWLASEVRSLGLPVISETISGVETGGDTEDVMLLNLHLRTAHRVLWLVSEFRACSPDELYERILALPWEDLISEEGYLSVTSTADTDSISDSRFANLKCKDAIVDRIRKKRGKRPDSGPDRSGAVVHLYWKESTASVFIDTSGESLSKRGYRKLPWKAPLQETLASALVMAAGFNGEGNFVNPMCGGGTLAIEAALKSAGKAPGLLRSNFGFMHIRDYDQKLWHKLQKDARTAMKRSSGRIIATDIDPLAVQSAKTNAMTAGMEHLIEFGISPFSETPVPSGSGIVILNPPYGERLGQEKELEDVYTGIGDFFKQKCSGYKGYVFTGNTSLPKKIGLRTRRKMQFFNGSIECRLLEYELYSGTRKSLRNQTD